MHRHGGVVHNFVLKECVLYCMLPMAYTHICSYDCKLQVVEVLIFVYKMVNACEVREV